MEEEQSVDLPNNFSEEPLSAQSLTRIRALIINPSTPDSTISSLFETLTRSLELNRDTNLLHHTLKLLSDLSSHRNALSGLILDLLRRHALHTAVSTRLAAESLDVVVSIAERGPALAPAADELGGGIFTSLCFSSPVSIWLWLLRNAERFSLTPSSPSCTTTSTFNLFTPNSKILSKTPTAPSHSPLAALKWSLLSSILSNNSPLSSKLSLSLSLLMLSKSKFFLIVSETQSIRC
ncbi:hypothetical protein L484_016369 [Morus notabilis]|uniref:Uncharacterized protein n=1 Tax=Morus notabilis TaxID=981085 RepID=W9RNB5_9ROSA|nr:hypothetical protein L484_016369 [Morus notabilis]